MVLIALNTNSISVHLWMHGMCTFYICLLHNNMHCQTFGVLSLLLYGNRHELHLVPSSPVGMVKTPFTLSSSVYLKK